MQIIIRLENNSLFLLEYNFLTPHHIKNEAKRSMLLSQT